MAVAEKRMDERIDASHAQLTFHFEEIVEAANRTCDRYHIAPCAAGVSTLPVPEEAS